jgi:IS30 family transposase
MRWDGHSAHASEPGRLNLEEKYMIRELHRKGVSISEIARQTGSDRKTVRKALREG